jgi:hypothetical protein
MQLCGKYCPRIDGQGTKIKFVLSIKSWILIFLK